MIKIYLLDFSGADADKIYLPALRGYIEKTKNPTLGRERIFSYMLLEFAYRESFFRHMPSIERDEYGRPYFIGESIDFNLSHDGDMAALVISDEGRVGIDVQRTDGAVSHRLIDKTNEIFTRHTLSSLSESETLADINLFYYSENDEILKSEIDLSNDEENSQAYDFFDKWTLIEALSKADGRGLALLSRIDFNKEKFLYKRARVKDRNGNIYALCVCKKL